MDSTEPASRSDRLRAILLHAFPGAEVTVRDDSALHAGHAGARPGGQTHYAVRVVAPGFAGMTRLARSRAVYAALDAEFGTGLHALALELRAPGEG